MPKVDCPTCGKTCKNNAGLAAHRRGGHRVVSRVDDLRADYEMLGLLLRDAEGSGAASIARERRIIGAELERLDAPEEVPFVDELAAKRTKSGARRPSSRRKSG